MLSWDIARNLERSRWVAHDGQYLPREERTVGGIQHQGTVDVYQCRLEVVVQRQRIGILGQQFSAYALARVAGRLGMVDTLGIEYDSLVDVSQLDVEPSLLMAVVEHLSIGCTDSRQHQNQK